MQLHQIRQIHKNKKRKRKGRGDTYAGRGKKGQHTRAGRRMKPAIRGVIKRYPKLRGYRFKSRQTDPQVVNLNILEQKFQKGETVSPVSLLEKELISKAKGQIPQVKILGKGRIEKSLTFESCQFSDKAKQKIEKAGGKIK